MDTKIYIWFSLFQINFIIFEINVITYFQDICYFTTIKDNTTCFWYLSYFKCTWDTKHVKSLNTLTYYVNKVLYEKVIVKSVWKMREYGENSVEWSIAIYVTNHFRCLPFYELIDVRAHYLAHTRYWISIFTSWKVKNDLITYKNMNLLHNKV